MAESKIDVAFGGFRFSAEGSESWLSQELDKAFDRVVDRPEIMSTPKETVKAKEETSVGPKLAINSIAARLGVSTGSDLVIAAAFSLTRGEKTTATRAEIVAEMKRATSYYKTSFTSNLSNYISTLIKEGRLLDQGVDCYAVSSQTRIDFEAKLA